MNFVSPLFLFYLCAFLLVRWILFPSCQWIFNRYCNEFYRERHKQLVIVWILLLGSYLFYASWNYEFLALLAFTSFSDFQIGKRIFLEKNHTNRKILLFTSVFLNLSILGFFKYFYFITENLVLFGSLFNISLLQLNWEILLPAGISFYTFQSLSYTIDVYRGILPPETRFSRYALFLAFFPQLVAGPIVVARDFLPQIATIYRQKFSDLSLNQAFYLILIGFIKKSVIADNISTISDMVFQSPEQIKILSWSFILMGMFAYSIQIYCDFSGYTDIARGVAILFGFHLPENFNLPYFASSLTDFWRRWHISLSSWLQSYLYIPLGGNRNGAILTYRNLFITMLLGGLWHGASWNFIIWGSLHGLYLSGERFLIQRFSNRIFISDVRPIVKRTGKLFYAMMTFWVVTCFWVFFRSPDFATSLQVFKSLFCLQPGIDPNHSMEVKFFSIVFIVFLSHYIGYFRKEIVFSFISENASILKFAIYAVLAILSVIYSGELKPFIYFVF